MIDKVCEPQIISSEFSFPFQKEKKLGQQDNRWNIVDNMYILIRQANSGTDKKVDKEQTTDFFYIFFNEKIYMTKDNRWKSVSPYEFKTS